MALASMDKIIEQIRSLLYEKNAARGTCDKIRMSGNEEKAQPNERWNERQKKKEK